MPIDEVMVHVSAPTSKKDDDRYRRLALASQDFQLDNVVKLCLTGPHDDKSYGHGSRTPIQSSALPDISLDNGASIPDLEGSQREIINDSSNNISVPNVWTPPLGTLLKESRRTGACDTTVEYIDDSLRAKAALESQLLTSSLKALGYESPYDTSIEYIDDSLRAKTALESQLLTSSLKALGYESPFVHGVAFQTQSSPLPLSHNEDTISNAASQQQKKQSSSSPRDATWPNSEHAVLGRYERISNPPAVSASPAKHLPAIEDPMFPSPFAPEILPPLPPTAIYRGPVNHITPAFHQLAETLNLSSRFKPLYTGRALRPLERGHWYIKTMSWEPEIQQDFWSFLGEFIKAGSAGWGVSCFRVAPIDDDGTISKTTSANAQLGVVKIYCWGETVGHVYLLAFVASKSKVKRVGAKWVDASEQVIIQMP